MDEQGATPFQGVLDDLAGLAKEGVDDPSLARRHHLLGMVLEVLGMTESAMDGERRALLLRDVLIGTFDKERQATLDRLGSLVTRQQYRRQSSNRVSAAAELLGMTDHDLFNRLKDRTFVLLAKEWAEARSKDQNSGAARQRQSRASLWLGAASPKTGYRFQRDDLPVVLEAAIRRHLANPDVRAELADKYINRPTESSPAAAFHGKPAILSPDLKQATENLHVEVHDEVGTWRQRQSPDNDFLPVSWKTADQDKYFGHWIHIRGDGSNEPIPLAGSFSGIGAVFKSIPSRRLVILGKGGAGRTVLAYELAWQLLRERLEGDPVPVIFNFATWNPQAESLRDWLANELHTHYQPGRPKNEGDTGPEVLLKAGVILPILDGFDEISSELRRAAYKHLDADGVRQFVVTSRPDEYLEAVGKSPRRLGRTPVVELADLSLDQIEDYLRLSTPPTNAGDEDASSWEPVLRRMRGATDDQGTSLLEVLSLPLMVFLARSIYRSSRARPQELLDRDSFPDAASIRRHLLDAYIPAMYEKTPAGRNSKWDGSENSQGWLGFLALCNVEQESQSFVWWKPSRLMDEPLKVPMFYIMAVMPTLLLLGVAATVAGLALREDHANMADSLINVASPALVGIGFLGMYSLLSFGPIFQPRTFVWCRAGVRPNVDRPRYPAWRPYGRRELQYRKSDGAGIGVFLFILYWAAMAVGRNPLTGLPIALLVLVVVLYSPRALSVSNAPSALFRADLIASLSRGVAFTIGAVLVSAGLWLTGGNVSLWTGVACLIILWLGALQSASGSWFVRRLGLAAKGYLPWECLQFFDDAYERGILRLSGGGYQFRHAFLQNHLAKQYVESFPDVDWPSKLVVADFMAGESDSHEAIAHLRQFIEGHRQKDEKERAADAWQLVINILRELGRCDEALREVYSMRESELASVRTIDYQCQRILIYLLKEVGDVQDAKEELTMLFGRLFKDERKILPNVTGPAKRFRVELENDPTLDDLR
ncbi:NACHT domain-containing protein [Actinomadura sp. DSM 109109]|nr:NACHT domain-containing protein [Actinomadura lepetitiana]